MNYSNYNSPISNNQAIGIPKVDFNQVMRLVYTWMGLGLLATAGMAWFAATNEAIAPLRTSSVVWLISILALFGTVIALSAGIRARWMTPTVAMLLFFGFALINGFSLSLLFQYFIENQPNVLYSAFGTSAAVFGAMSIYGYTTKADLSSWRTYLVVGLIGIVIAMVINWFLASSALSFIISIAGVIIFTALTAYDTQKIKELSMVPELQSDGNLALKFSLLGALTLYLDFINLFLFLLRLFSGGGRD